MTAHHVDGARPALLGQRFSRGRKQRPVEDFGGAQALEIFASAKRPVTAATLNPSLASTATATLPTPGSPVTKISPLRESHRGVRAP
jgi:hypothetical protein